MAYPSDSDGVPMNPEPRKWFLMGAEWKEKRLGGDGGMTEEKTLNMRFNLLLRAAEYVHQTIPNTQMDGKRTQVEETFASWEKMVFGE